MSIINVVGLTLIWTALTGDISVANIVLGAAVSTLLVWLGINSGIMKRGEEQSERLRSVRFWIKKIPVLISFLLVFLWEVIKANVEIVLIALSADFRNVKPGIIAVPLDVTTDAEITMFANMITLTPGTLSIDVSDDRKIIYVYAIDMDDPETKKQEIKDSLESLVHEVFR